MTLQEITAKMKEGAGKKSPFGNTVKFSTDQGVVFIDGNDNPPSVSNDDHPPGESGLSLPVKSKFRKYGASGGPMSDVTSGRIE